MAWRHPRMDLKIKLFDFVEPVYGQLANECCGSTCGANYRNDAVIRSVQPFRPDIASFVALQDFDIGALGENRRDALVILGVGHQDVLRGRRLASATHHCGG